MPFAFDRRTFLGAALAVPLSAYLTACGGDDGAAKGGFEGDALVGDHGVGDEVVVFADYVIHVDEI